MSEPFDSNFEDAIRKQEWPKGNGDDISPKIVVKKWCSLLLESIQDESENKYSFEQKSESKSESKTNESLSTLEILEWLQSAFLQRCTRECLSPLENIQIYLTLKEVINKASSSGQRCKFAVQALAATSLSIIPISSSIHVMHTDISLEKFLSSQSKVLQPASTPSPSTLTKLRQQEQLHCKDVLHRIGRQPFRESDRYDKEAMWEIFQDTSTSSIGFIMLANHLQWLFRKHHLIRDFTVKYESTVRTLLTRLAEHDTSMSMLHYLHQFVKEQLQVMKFYEEDVELSSAKFSNLRKKSPSKKKSHQKEKKRDRIDSRSNDTAVAHDCVSSLQAVQHLLQDLGKDNFCLTQKMKILMSGKIETREDEDSVRLKASHDHDHRSSNPFARIFVKGKRNRSHSEVAMKPQDVLVETHDERYNPDQYAEVHMDEIIAQVENIWLQTDPIVGRTLSVNDTNDDEFSESGKRNNMKNADEMILTSIKSGLLQMSKRELIWRPHYSSKTSKSGKVINEYRESIAMTLDFASVAHYTWGLLNQTTDVVSGGGSGGGNSGSSEWRSSGSGSLDELNPALMVTRPTEEYYISLYSDKVYKLFPFYGREIDEIVAAIADVSGIQPYTEYEYKMEIEKQKIELARTQVLNMFLERGVKWIDHTSELINVIERLTTKGEQKLRDLELLFHSCRVNHKVAQEAFNIMIQMWNDNHSPVVRLRMLVIIERLLDRAIVQTRHGFLSTIETWLQNIEDHLDPQNSMRVVKEVLKLKKKASKLRDQPLATLSDDQLSNEFCMLNELKAFQNNTIDGMTPIFRC